MGIRDVEIPERIGEEIPCERCRNMKMQESVYNFCFSYKFGHISDEEMRNVLEDAAMDSRLHKECAESLIESIMERYRPKKMK